MSRSKYTDRSTFYARPH